MLIGSPTLKMAAESVVGAKLAFPALHPSLVVLTFSLANSLVTYHQPCQNIKDRFLDPLANSDLWRVIPYFLMVPSLIRPIRPA